jgi:hypothetical protein
MVALVDALSAYDLSFNQIEIFSSGTGNAPFELRTPDVFRGLVAWRERRSNSCWVRTGACGLSCPGRYRDG